MLCEAAGIEEEVQCSNCASVTDPDRRIGALEYAHLMMMPPKRVFPRQESLLLPAVVNPFRLDFKLTKSDKIKVSAVFFLFSLRILTQHLAGDTVTEMHG